jgi:hypothetical protein
LLEAFHKVLLEAFLNKVLLEAFLKVSLFNRATSHKVVFLMLFLVE